MTDKNKKKRRVRIIKKEQQGMTDLDRQCFPADETMSAHTLDIWHMMLVDAGKELKENLDGTVVG